MKPVGTSKCENHFSSNTASLNCKRNRENTKLKEALGFSKFNRKETVASMDIGLRCNILVQRQNFINQDTANTMCISVFLSDAPAHTFCYIP